MYKLLDYDITEYKQLENTLNELSKQGYNPTSLGKISRFEKNEKHYYFHVDLLIKKPATPKRKALHDFINEYEKQMFDYYGKIGKRFGGKWRHYDKIIVIQNSYTSGCQGTYKK